MQAAFFDLDGCLVDSREPISTAMNAALDELSLPTRDPSELYEYIGPPLLRSFQKILLSLGADPALAEQAVTAYRRTYPDLAVTTTKPVPGIAEVLAELSGRMTLMVVTSKPREYAEPIVRSVGLARYFEAVFGPALEALTEPKSAKLEQALDLSGVGREDRRTRAVMIGDREHDILAGKTCGTATIGVTWGIGDRAELAAAGADTIVDRPHEILDQGTGSATSMPVR